MRRNESINQTVVTVNSLGTFNQQISFQYDKAANYNQ